MLQGLVASLFPAVADASDISRFLSVFQKPHAELIQAARQLLSDERAPLRQKLLADLLGTVSENIAAETRAEDAPWFEGASWSQAWRERAGRASSGPACWDMGSVPVPRPRGSPSAGPGARQPWDWPFYFYSIFNCGQVGMR